MKRSEQLYLRGKTTVFSSNFDPRFAFCMYVPADIGHTEQSPELVVCVHGSFRNFTQNRDAFSEFGRWNNCVVLSPLFPVGPAGDNHRFGYMMLKEGDIRYDRVLLSMIDQASEMLGCRFDQFALCGYSGGGQFANRFGLLYADRLWALSIGAPGAVTLLDFEQNWWVGVGDLEDHFGFGLDLHALQKLPVHMVVGLADIETWEITFDKQHPLYAPGADDTGTTRIERLQTLRRTFEDAGISVKFDLLPNVPHDVFKTMGAVQDFFATVLSKKRFKKNPQS